MENPAMKEFRLKWTENASKGTKKASGSFLLNGSLFAYTLNEQKNGLCVMRGQVCLRGEDGKTLKATGLEHRAITERLKKQNRGKDGSLPENYENSKAFLAQKQITVQSMAEKDIRDKVLHAAEKLYAENIYTIEQDRKNAPVDGLRPVKAVCIYKKSFFDRWPRRITPPDQAQKRKEVGTDCQSIGLLRLEQHITVHPASVAQSAGQRGG